MKKIIVVSGLSGSGKTSVTNVLEDLGYVCIDQLPMELLDDLFDLIQNDTSARYEHVCITLPIEQLDTYFHQFENMDIKTDLILLDTDYETLLNRYKFTRRIHPLLVGNKANTLEEAINIEKEILNRYVNDYNVINTTHTGPYELKDIVENLIKVDRNHQLTISFESFGFKHGIPQDADIVLDVRFLENPFYHAELKNLTGDDEPVYNFVMNDSKTQKYIEYLNPFLDYNFAEYAKEGKRHLTVAVGCTGGHHRSATITNYLYNRYADRYNCLKKHRDIKK